MRLLLSEEDASCLGTQSCKTIIQIYFDDRLCSGISERPEQLLDAVNEIGPLVSVGLQIVLRDQKSKEGFKYQSVEIY